MGERPLISKVPRYFKKYMDFFADLCQQEFAFLQYPPSLLAAAIVAASRRALRVVYVGSGDCGRCMCACLTCPRGGAIGADRRGRRTWTASLATARRKCCRASHTCGSTTMRRSPRLTASRSCSAVVKRARVLSTWCVGTGVGGCDDGECARVAPCSSVSRPPCPVCRTRALPACHGWFLRHYNLWSQIVALSCCGLLPGSCRDVSWWCPYSVAWRRVERLLCRALGGCGSVAVQA